MNEERQYMNIESYGDGEIIVVYLNNEFIISEKSGNH